MSPQPKLSIAAQFPKDYFLENIAMRRDNSMLITAVQPKALYYVPPPKAGEVCEPILLHNFNELPTGIAELDPDVFVVLAGNVYTTHENYIYRLDLRSWRPGAPVKVEMIFAFPKAALGLNGCCALSAKTILAADSLAGAIWRVDFERGGPQAKVWLKHDSMAHVPDTLPPPTQPGINGLRYSAADGYVYYTTTGQKIFMRVRVDPVTFDPVGQPELVTQGGMYDDFCIDAERGVAYLTVHRENRIDQVELARDEASVPLAGAPLNEMLLGPSSAAWSRAPDEAGRVVYVTTDGGHTAPPPDGAQTSKVLRLELAN